MDAPMRVTARPFCCFRLGKAGVPGGVRIDVGLTIEFASLVMAIMVSAIRATRWFYLRYAGAR
jgi:hypothetical protein